MAGRSEVERSAAYKAMADTARRVFHEIEATGGGAISLDQLMDATGRGRSAVRHGVRQCEVLGFVAVAMTARRTNEFRLADGWAEVSAEEAKHLLKLAKLPTPPRATSSPPKPVRPVKVRVEVEPPPPRAAPSMPVVAWLQRSSSPRRGQDQAG
jgi:hypothetical protein